MGSDNKHAISMLFRKAEHLLPRYVSAHMHETARGEATGGKRTKD
jgi:hypothetical protein